MAHELQCQLEQPQRYKAYSFEDRLALLVDAEARAKRDRSIKRRISSAKFSEPGACIEGIEYYEDRNLNHRLISKLATCSYIDEKHHVVLKGAAGAGKSYIANALGVAACQKLYRVRYNSLSDLLNEYKVSKDLYTQSKVKKYYARLDLLIIDEWLLRPLDESSSYDLLELMQALDNNTSLILCTQYDTDDWYYRIDCDRDADESSAVAEGIIDRIINNKYTIDLKGKESMRKRHAFEGGFEEYE